MENVPSGLVQTVLGPVDPSTLGITLTHEHLQNFEIPKNMSNKVAFLRLKMCK